MTPEERTERVIEELYWGIGITISETNLRNTVLPHIREAVQDGRSETSQILDAYRVLQGAMQELAAGHFHRDERYRIEGAADALNWVLNLDNDLARLFESNIQRLRKARENARLSRMLPSM